MSRKHMEDLKKKADKELQEMYDEANLIISKAKGQIGIGAPLEKHYREYKRALTRRARVLTVLNQRRHERRMRTKSLGECMECKDTFEMKRKHPEKVLKGVLCPRCGTGGNRR